MGVYGVLRAVDEVRQGSRSGTHDARRSPEHLRILRSRTSGDAGSPQRRIFGPRERRAVGV